MSYNKQRNFCGNILRKTKKDYYGNLNKKYVIDNKGFGKRRAGDTGWAGERWPPPLFCVAKRKRGNKRKKERLSKQNLLKDCHQGQNVTVLAILERLEFKNCSGRSTMVVDNTFQCSMTPPL